MNDASLDDIQIRELSTLAEYQACVALQDETWGAGFSERVPGAILRVGQKIGGITAGAFDVSGRMIGFVFGLTGVRNGKLVHWSDMLAVIPEFRSHHLGERLKHYQANAVRALGVKTMIWTYDPLVARNAHFNINRLGAFPVEYVPDMYGSNTGSTLHGEMPTDRFVVEWDLETAQPALTHTDQFKADDDALPLANPLDPLGAPTAGVIGDAVEVRMQVPVDSAAIQQVDPARAERWRYAVRNTCMALLASNFRVVRFVRAHADHLPYYVLSREGA